MKFLLILGCLKFISYEMVTPPLKFTWLSKVYFLLSLTKFLVPFSLAFRTFIQKKKFLIAIVNTHQYSTHNYPFFLSHFFFEMCKMKTQMIGFYILLILPDLFNLLKIQWILRIFYCFPLLMSFFRMMTLRTVGCVLRNYCLESFLNCSESLLTFQMSSKGWFAEVLFKRLCFFFVKL